MTKETISETAALKALLSETADHQILAEMRRCCTNTGSSGNRVLHL